MILFIKKCNVIRGMFYFLEIYRSYFLRDDFLGDCRGFVSIFIFYVVYYKGFIFVSWDECIKEVEVRSWFYV